MASSVIGTFVFHGLFQQSCNIIFLSLISKYTTTRAKIYHTQVSPT